MKIPGVDLPVEPDCASKSIVEGPCDAGALADGDSRDVCGDPSGSRLAVGFSGRPRPCFSVSVFLLRRTLDPLPLRVPALNLLIPKC